MQHVLHQECRLRGLRINPNSHYLADMQSLSLLLTNTQLHIKLSEPNTWSVHADSAEMEQTTKFPMDIEFHQNSDRMPGASFLPFHPSRQWHICPGELRKQKNCAPGCCSPPRWYRCPGHGPSSLRKTWSWTPCPRRRLVPKALPSARHAVRRNSQFY